MNHLTLVEFCVRECHHVGTKEGAFIFGETIGNNKKKFTHEGSSGTKLSGWQPSMQCINQERLATQIWQPDCHSTTKIYTHHLKMATQCQPNWWWLPQRTNIATNTHPQSSRNINENGFGWNGSGHNGYPHHLCKVDLDTISFSGSHFLHDFQSSYKCRSDYQSDDFHAQYTVM